MNLKQKLSFLSLLLSFKLISATGIPDIKQSAFLSEKSSTNCYSSIITSIALSKSNPREEFKLICPSDIKHSTCLSQEMVDSLFEVWKQSAVVTGGCNPVLMVDSTKAPNHCGGKVSVTFTATSECDSTLSCKAIFEVQASEATLFCPEDMVEKSCQTLNDINQKFEEWMKTAVLNKACNSIIETNINHKPDPCGDTSIVVFTAGDNCAQPKICEAKFIVKEADHLILQCPLSVTQDTGHTQAEIDSLFGLWKNSATFSGGCNSILIIGEGQAPKSIGGATIITYSLIDECQDTVQCNSKFKVKSINPVKLICPEDAIESSCQSQSTINSKFANWYSMGKFTGGCNAFLVVKNINIPKACGDKLTLVYEVISECEELVSCSASFTIREPNKINLVCPTSVTEAGCQAPEDISSKFNSWLNTATFTGGCNSVLSNNASSPPNACGGISLVTFKVESDCESPVTCTTTFKIDSVPPVLMICPANITEAACQSQTSINTKFESWKNSASFTGGCHGTLTVPGSFAPSFCGGSISITYAVVSDCEPVKTCTSTFTVLAPTPITLNCPETRTEAACQTQASIDTKFNEWKNSVSFSGGCFGEVSNTLSSAPSNCGGSSTITYSVISQCEPTISCTAKFTVEASQPVAISCPANQTETACKSQSSIDSNFINWKNMASFTGGCNGVFINSGGISPHFCGGSTTVTFTVISDCEGPKTCNSTFKVEPSPFTLLTCPENKVEAACQFQATIDTKFNEWKNTVKLTGGCNAVLVDNSNEPPSACGGVASVTFMVSSDCESNKSCTSTFSVNTAPPVVITCPTNQTEAACQSQSAINTKFNSWKNTAEYTGGCNGVFTNNGATPPNACGSRTSVTFTVSSDCESPKTCTATFSVTTAPEITLTCPPNKKVNTSDIQFEIDTAFNNWKKLAVFTGGCNGVLTNSGGAPPNSLGGTTIVTYTVSSDCAEPIKCQSTFTVGGGGVFTSNPKFDQIEIYPNPAKEYLIIKSKSLPLKNVKIEILDLQGRVYDLRKKVQHLEFEKINIESLTSGTYILKLTDESGTLERKFVVVK